VLEVAGQREWARRVAAALSAAEEAFSGSSAAR